MSCLTDQFWNFFITGLSTGTIYALIALGYTLVYGVLQLINFAHSEVFMLGAFGGLFTVRALVPGGNHTPGGFTSMLLVLAGVIAGALVGGMTAFLLERVAYRPLRRRRAPKLAFLISAIGASLFLSNLAGKEFGRFRIPMPSLYTDGTVFHVFSYGVRLTELIIAVAAVIMLVLLDRMVNATKLGQGIRAVAQDADTAGLMGVNIDRVISQTFVVGGLLGGAAGFLFAVAFDAQFNMGFLPGVKAFAAAVLGGIGNVRGAVLGGLLLGVVESLSTSCAGAQWQDVTAFVVLVLVLMFRPSGILGERLGRSA